MTPVQDGSSLLQYQYSNGQWRLVTQRPKQVDPAWHQNPRYRFWSHPSQVPAPLPIHLPRSAPPSQPPPNRLRRQKPQQQQQQQPQPQPPQPYPSLHPQPQMTQSHHSQPQPRGRCQSTSGPARRPRSPPASGNMRSHSRPAARTRDRSQSRSRPHTPHTSGEDADSNRAFFTAIANETIAALNNDFVDVSTTQKHTQLFLESSRELKDWRCHQPRPSSHNNNFVTTKIEFLAVSTLKGARHLNTQPQPTRKIGVLNFASATNPGGGFLNGARAQEESIARSSSLYASLTTDAARPFYALHAGRGENDGFYTHAMIYSPQVHLFRDDDGSWLDSLPVDVVTSPAVNAGKVRRRALFAGKRLEQKIEDTMCERMGRILTLFEMKGATSLVLGSFGTGVFQNDVGVVARIWRHLLWSRDARFKSSFREVVFCIPDAQTRAVFEAAWGGGGGPYVPAGGGGEVLEGTSTSRDAGRGRGSYVPAGRGGEVLAGASTSRDAGRGRGPYVPAGRGGEMLEGASTSRDAGRHGPYVPPDRGREVFQGAATSRGAGRGRGRGPPDGGGDGVP